MGQFATLMFNALLGWVQAAASWLWSLITNADVSLWGRWMLDHWLLLVALLCVGGVVIDFIVYLIRWQPYRVWRSFLQRMSGKQEEVEDGVPSAPVYQRKWIYADGTSTVEEVREPVQNQPVQEQADQLPAPIRPGRRVARRSSPEQAYYQPVYPPQWRENQEQQGEHE